MTDTNIYRDIAIRTDGAFMLGVVGPVRTGKSSFIKRFMEMLVIPQIKDAYMRERARDELPQSGSGRTITTAEPKFVPEEAVSITLADGTPLSVRLVDCVGYMVEGAAGQYEEGSERMVTTPWFDSEIPIAEAAEKGTEKVIAEHSTIGLVVTTDGSICDIPRENYVPAEERVIRELQALGKPFVVLLNCTEPQSDAAAALANEIAEKYGTRCIALNCLSLDETDVQTILSGVLEEFPIQAVSIYLPEWFDALGDGNALRAEVLESIVRAGQDLHKIKDSYAMAEAIGANDRISAAKINGTELGTGVVSLAIQLPRALYYETISEQTGIEIKNDADLISTLTDMSVVMEDYTRLKSALDDVREKGYGVVIPDASQMRLEEPQIVRQGGKYTVKLKANAPAIHMLMTDVETEVTPAIGGETASEEIISFLLQGFNGDVNRIWESNIFGKSLNDIAEEGLTAKLQALPENAKSKLREALQRIINEGSGGLICILL
ncbi:MAG: stage IV sporulation protein A [Oscillospiraceae bacterium]|nr:stage IV sporulation protein A [Oscillospiraceae bacterium]